MNAAEAIAASMSADMARLTSVSHNLVNAGTPAYQREIARAPPFSAWMASSPDAVRSTTSPVISASLDTRAGALRHTAQSLDVALETPETYLEVQTDNGVAYTRRGDLTLDAQGTLCDHAGRPVLGLNGPLFIESGAPAIDKDGAVRVADLLIGRLKLTRFEDASKLEQLQGGLFAQGAATVANETQPATVRQYHLEASNVDTAAEMVTLMEAMRHFEAGQRVLQGMDDMLDRALRKLGEFG
jgi:flagellar basal-body rod protein FlgF